MAMIPDEELRDQLLGLCRGCEAVYTQVELEKRLRHAAETRRPLRVKLGLDPTAPDIHLGHTVQLRKMRRFQDLGHRAVLIIGDYTARVGDPTGVNKTRPVLSPEQIEANARTYFDQAGKILDTSSEKLEVRHNSQWLSDLNLADVLRLAGLMTVARMMERDTFQLRYQAGTPIGLHEFLYPIMQGYDSVCIEADVELGGTDQTFNNLVGRDLQKACGQLPQVVMILPILVGLDGAEKMSKSKGNYVGVTDEPNDMFGKVMSIPDSAMRNYYELLTDLPRDEIAALLDADRTHPRDAKARLGRTLVEAYHGRDAAESAAAEFARVFAEHRLPTDLPALAVPAGPMNIVELVMKAAFAKSTSEARRLICQHAVSIDGEKVTDVNACVEVSSGQVFRVGKRRFARIAVR